MNDKNQNTNTVGLVETKTVRVVEQQSPLQLECGKSLGPVDVAYETYGRLNADKSNVIYICHALSGNAHVAGKNNPGDRKAGWWDNMVGPGKAIDTDKYFVICSNCLGGCSGTTGPSEINPDTGKKYGLEFPIITISDMVRVQKLLLEKLGIDKVLAIIGGSMGGMQVLQWSINYPDFARSAIVIASTTHLSPQGIAFDAVGRNAIIADKNFAAGNYNPPQLPEHGLAIARMIGHITYLSEKSMRDKFGRKLRNAEDYSYDFASEFSVETYLSYQGQTFVERFDANSYLYITKAMDYFDLEKEHGSLEKAFAKTRCRFLIVSFTSDWLFPPSHSEEMLKSLAINGKDVSYCNIDSPYGHDSFLLEPETLGPLLSGFINTTFDRQNDIQKERQRQPELQDVTIYDSPKRARIDYELIEQIIQPDSKVLDVGCGNGELLTRLVFDKNITAEGIEVSQDLVINSVNKGLSVIHRDVERGLDLYPDNSFDYVILSQTLQTIMDAERVFREMLRVGKKVVISFPNFAYWKCRVQLFVQGCAPKSPELPYEWHNSPNIHFLSLKDFDNFCEKLDIRIERKIPIVANKLSPVSFAPNLLAEQAVYVTSKK